MQVRSKAKITSKGQLTLPAVVRRELGVGAGDAVVFELSPDGIRVVRDRDVDVFEKWEGRFRRGSGLTAAQIDKQLRIVRGHEDE